MNWCISVFMLRVIWFLMSCLLVLLSVKVCGSGGSCVVCCCWMFVSR